MAASVLWTTWKETWALLCSARSGRAPVTPALLRHASDHGDAWALLLQNPDGPGTRSSSATSKESRLHLLQPGDPRAEAEAEQSTFHREACGRLVICHTIPRWPGPTAEMASIGQCTANTPSNADFGVTTDSQERLSYLIVISNARVIFKTEYGGQGETKTLKRCEWERRVVKLWWESLQFLKQSNNPVTT